MLTVIFGNLVVCHSCVVQNCSEGRCCALVQLWSEMRSRSPRAGTDGGLVCLRRTAPLLALSGSATVNIGDVLEPGGTHFSLF